MMTEVEFDERFEGLINDIEYKQSQDLPLLPTYRKLYKLLGAYIDHHDRVLYERKNLQNGSD